MEYFLIASVVALATACIVYLIYEDNSLQITRYKISLDGFPSKLKIVHISDYHNRRFKGIGERISRAVRSEKPDAVFITGDIIDRRRTHVDRALEFAASVCGDCPVYYCMGNHERLSEYYPDLKLGLSKLGIIILENETVPFSEDIWITGAKDMTPDDVREFVSGLENHKTDILLIHRPEMAETVSESCVDISFSGHAHGGQFRLPGGRGVYAPHQGILPKYTQGAVKVNGMYAVISRGIGNSLFPIRINNRPELVIAEITGKEEK